MAKKKPACDVAGQIGGPSPDVQAAVDAEQREIIARMRAAREPIERADAEKFAAKVAKAKASAKARKSLENTVKALIARVEALEKKNG